MEELKLSYKAEKPAEKNIQIQVGVVSSGDLEVLFQSEVGDTSFSVQVTSPPITANNGGAIYLIDLLQLKSFPLEPC